MPALGASDGDHAGKLLNQLLCSTACHAKAQACALLVKSKRWARPMSLTRETLIYVPEGELRATVGPSRRLPPAARVAHAQRLVLPALERRGLGTARVVHSVLPARRVQLMIASPGRDPGSRSYMGSVRLQRLPQLGGQVLRGPSPGE